GHVSQLDFCETIAGRMLQKLLILVTRLHWSKNGRRTRKGVMQKLLILVTRLHCLPHRGPRQPPSYAHREQYSAYYRSFHWMLLVLGARGLLLVSITRSCTGIVVECKSKKYAIRGRWGSTSV